MVGAQGKKEPDAKKKSLQLDVTVGGIYLFTIRLAIDVGWATDVGCMYSN